MVVQDERGRRKQVLARLNNLALVANMLAAIVVIFYFALYDWPFTPERLSGLVENFIFLILLIVGMKFFSIWRQLEAWEQWYLQVPAPEPATPEMQRKALQQPANTASMSLMVWSIISFFSFISGLMITDNRSLHNVLAMAFANLIGIGFISGPIAALVVYFSTERVWQAEMPIFFPEGHLSEVEAFRMTLRRRVFLLFVSTLMPLLFLSVISYSYVVGVTGEPQPDLLFILSFVLGIGLLLVVTLARTLGASLVRAVERLQDHVARVRAGDLETRLPVTSNDEFGALTEDVNAMVDSLRQEETIRRLFSLYVTPEVAEHAIHYGAKLGGQLTEATVLFSDIRSFTAMTEEMPPEALIALLNRYFDAMSKAIIAHGGFVNKFGGDSLLAIFGSPLNPEKDHAVRAVNAAQAMLEALDAFNTDQEQRGEARLRIGLGIATGAVVAGNVGSEERLEYTVIGDTVNLASRLQSMTKELAFTLLVDEPTAGAIGASFPLVSVGEVQVRGKQEPVAVYTLTATSNQR